jgi:hypothetical protein
MCNAVADLMLEVTQDYVMQPVVSTTPDNSEHI